MSKNADLREQNPSSNQRGGSFMASMKDAEQLTKNLEGLVGDLKTELRDGKGDFEKLIQMADQISESADGFAETFSSINETLTKRIQEVNGGGSGSRQSSGSREKAGSRS
jgi:chromosome segregation ATPase